MQDAKAVLNTRAILWAIICEYMEKTERAPGRLSSALLAATFNLADGRGDSGLLPGALTYGSAHRPLSALYEDNAGRDDGQPLRPPVANEPNFAHDPSRLSQAALLHNIIDTCRDDQETVEKLEDFMRKHLL